MQPVPKAKSFGSGTVTDVRSLTDWSPKWKEELPNEILEVIKSVEVRTWVKRILIWGTFLVVTNKRRVSSSVRILDRRKQIAQLSGDTYNIARAL